MGLFMKNSKDPEASARLASTACNAHAQIADASLAAAPYMRHLVSCFCIQEERIWDDGPTPSLLP